MLRKTGRRLCCLYLCAALLCAAAPAASAAVFRDVPDSHWAGAAIERCAELGIFEGTDDAVFGVGKPMTRLALVVVLGRMFGWKAAAPAHALFTDVPANAWYAGALQAACEQGVVSRQDSAFRPGDGVTREELAVMLVRAMGYGSAAAAAETDELPFRDVQTNRGYIALAYRLGVIKGVNSVSFAPRRVATREQTAVMLVRVYDLLHAGLPQMAILSAGETLPETWSGGTAAVDAATLLPTYSPLIINHMDSTEEEAAVDALRQSGSTALLRVTGQMSAMQADAAEAARCIAGRLASLGYDGVLVDLGPRTQKELDWLAKLILALREQLPEALLAAAADVPAGDSGLSLDALSAAADRLVLRVAAHKETVSGFPVAAAEPLDGIYSALTQISGPGLYLQLTVTGSGWDSDRETGPVSTAEIGDLLRAGAAAYTSDQYHCAYLTQGTRTVWYATEEGLADRIHLAACLGASGVCYDSVGTAAA